MYFTVSMPLIAPSHSFTVSMPLLTPTHSFMTCGGREAFTSTTIRSKSHIKTMFGRAGDQHRENPVAAAVPTQCNVRQLVMCVGLLTSDCMTLVCEPFNILTLRCNDADGGLEAT